ncbi:MAG: AAA family ATPase, partial [Gammaproteobacteria bacterium]|nr:AAA family ATPase [Gammaproteobacteria bacterium]
MNTPDPSILLQESEVYRHCESARVELGDAGAPLRPVGQARAEAAIRFGLRSARAGFNIYAAGPPSTGKRWLAEKLAREYAATQTPAFDVLYAPVPTQPQRLQIIKAAPGSAAGLADNMDRFLAQLSQASNRDHCL